MTDETATLSPAAEPAAAATSSPEDPPKRRAGRPSNAARQAAELAAKIEDPQNALFPNRFAESSAFDVPDQLAQFDLSGSSSLSSPATISTAMTPIEFVNLQVKSASDGNFANQLLSIMCQSLEKMQIPGLFRKLFRVARLTEPDLWRIVQYMAANTERLKHHGLIRINASQIASQMRTNGRGIEFEKQGLKPIPTPDLAIYFTNGVIPMQKLDV